MKFLKFLTVIFLLSCIGGKTIFAFNISSSPNSDITVAPSPVYFGYVPISSEAIREISIFNISSSSVTISNFEIKGADKSKYEIVNNPGSLTLALLENYVLEVKYIPTEKKEDSAILSLTTGAGVSETNLSGNGTTTNDGILMERIIGTVEPDGLGGIAQTSDGGYLLVGNTVLLDEQYSDFYIVKTDKYGSPVWQTTLGGDFSESAVDAVEMNGAYYVAGTTSTYGNGQNSVYLAKISAVGDKVWAKFYTGEYEDKSSSIIKTSDGNLLIAGSTNTQESSGRSALLLKISPDGTEIWRKSIGGDRSAKASQIIEVDDGYVFVGTAEISSGNFDIYLAKVDFSGNLIWEKLFGGDLSEAGNGVAATSDGGYILCGYTVSFGNGARDAFLVKVSSSLTQQWHKEFGNVNNDSFNRVLQLPSGGYIAVGSTVIFLDATNEYTNLFLITSDASGNKISEKEYGGERSETGNKLILADDSRYAIGGNTNSYSKDGDMYFLKVDADGNVTGIESELEINNHFPSDFSLEQNYPNPFNGQTTVKFNIYKFGYARLEIFNLLGQEVKSIFAGNVQPGKYNVQLDMNNFSSGNYIISLKFDGKIKTKKIVHLK